MAYGCAALSANGVVGINDEVAVIIWDKAHQTEHFVRSAVFHSKADKIGFLVPTPTTPELAVADYRIFGLAENYLPITRSLLKAVPASNSDGSVPVIVAEQDFGDYHAVTLAATDMAGLGEWLKKDGYAWTPGTANWLEPYLAKKWMITAFKVRRSASGVLNTKAIRMSFTTDRPFYPYSEPEEASKLGASQRTLRVAILSDERMEGKLGDGMNWPAHLDFAGSTTPPSYIHMDKDDWLKYAKLDGVSGIQLPTWLTYFSDYSNPRPGKSDLFFSASPDQSNYSP